MNTLRTTRTLPPLLGLLAGLAVLLGSARPASAVIEALTPLAKIVGDATEIVVAKVEKIDPAKPALVLTVERDLKGSLSPRRLPVAVVGDDEGRPDDLLQRVREGLPLVLFVTDLDTTRLAFAYTNGSWFQLIGRVDGETVRWRFTHPEPYLVRTYRDSTENLEQTLTAALAGTGTLPEVDAKAKPGLGPTLTPAPTAAPSDPVATNPTPEPAATPTPSAPAPAAVPPNSAGPVAEEIATRISGVMLLVGGGVLVLVLAAVTAAATFVLRPKPPQSD